MQRETIPDTKNVISQLKAIKLPFKSDTQRKKKTKPQKDSFIVSPVGQMVKVFDYQLQRALVQIQADPRKLKLKIRKFIF
jgi:hypothetical protein